MSDELLKFHRIQNFTDAIVILEQWRTVNNHVRSHEALRDRCPVQIYKPSQRAYQEQVMPYEYGSEHRVYKINNWGYVRFAHHQTYISQTFKDTYVQLIPYESEDSVMVCYRNFVIAKIDVTNGELMSRKAFRLKSLYN
jgi:hypothetical protein